jgi:IS1 family transposase
VVDFPLSTLPTTAHRTSGVRETLRGGNRNNKIARGQLLRVSNRTEAFNRSLGKWKI